MILDDKYGNVLDFLLSFFDYKNVSQMEMIVCSAQHRLHISPGKF